MSPTPYQCAPHLCDPNVLLGPRQVKRPGDKNVRCTILLLLDYQPPQFKLDSRLARLLGVHTQSRPVITQALWQYVKHNRLQVRKHQTQPADYRYSIYINHPQDPAVVIIGSLLVW